MTAPAASGTGATTAAATSSIAPATPPDEAKPAPAPSPVAPASGAESLAGVEARLDHMLRSAAHCSADSECRSVAVGGKACGGPTGYRAYSARLADPSAVQALAAQEHDLVMQAERDSHRVSNCLFMSDPGAHCEKQRCEIGTIGAPPPGGNPAMR